MAEVNEKWCWKCSRYYQFGPGHLGSEEMCARCILEQDRATKPLRAMPPLNITEYTDTPHITLDQQELSRQMMSSGITTVTGAGLLPPARTGLVTVINDRGEQLEMFALARKVELLRLWVIASATDEQGLIAGMLTDPEDRERRLVYADWLEEHNRVEEAAKWRQ